MAAIASEAPPYTEPTHCTIETLSVVAVDLLHPSPEMLLEADMIAALSNLCRFGGHVSRFYTVAEHSVHVCDAVMAAHPGDRTLALWALLHDATEAWVCDLPRPVKRLPGLQEAYYAAEARLMAAICEKYGLPGEMPAEVAAADNLILATERAHIRRGHLPALWGNLPPPLPLRQLRLGQMGWSRPVARDIFTGLLRDLTA